LNKPLRILITCSAIAFCGLLVAIFLQRKIPAEQNKPESASKPSPRVSRTADGDPQLTLDKAAQEHAGLKTKVLSAQTLRPEILAYGRLEEDPSQSFILRSPVAGILHSRQDGGWPGIGEKVASGKAIGIIEPRFMPTDRIALSGQLATARSELNASTAEVTAASASYERLRILNADRKNVSDRAVEEAQARLQGAEARLKGATDTVSLLESSLRSAGPAERMPLVMPREGDVVEVMAQPGESIESGSPILRLTRLDRLLARVDVPVGQHIPAGVSNARILPVGYDDQVIPAVRVALSVTIDPKTQGQSFLFRLVESRFGLRPGLSVTAFLSLPGASRQGVVIPGAAVVRLAGKAYAYIQTESDKFVRKEVPMMDPAAGGYFTPDNFAPGQRIVVVGAQMLLSEEFKSPTQVDQEGS
jgi:hypothetical protein